jgi:hypothetical protein
MQFNKNLFQIYIMKYTAKCRDRTCCPTIEYNPLTGYVTIKDDFAGSVTMRLEQFKDLAGNVNRLINNATIT